MQPQSSWQSFYSIMLNTPFSKGLSAQGGVVRRMRRCVVIRRLSRKCVQKKNTPGPAATALTSCSTEPSVNSFTKFLNTDMHSASGCASQTLRKPRSRVGAHSTGLGYLPAPPTKSHVSHRTAQLCTCILRFVHHLEGHTANLSSENYDF